MLSTTDLGYVYTPPSEVEKSFNKIIEHLYLYGNEENAKLLKTILTPAFIARNAASLKTMVYLTRDPLSVEPIRISNEQSGSNIDEKSQVYPQHNLEYTESPQGFPHGFPQESPNESDSSYEVISESKPVKRIKNEEYQLVDPIDPLEQQQLPPPRLPKDEESIVEELKMYLIGLTERPTGSLKIDHGLRCADMYKQYITNDNKSQVLWWNCKTIVQFILCLHSLVLTPASKTSVCEYSESIVGLEFDKLRRDAELLGITYECGTLTPTLDDIKRLSKQVMSDETREKLLTAWKELGGVYLAQSQAILSELAINKDFEPSVPLLPTEYRQVVDYCFPPDRLRHYWERVKQNYGQSVEFELEMKDLFSRVENEIRECDRLNEFI